MINENGDMPLSEIRRDLLVTRRDTPIPQLFETFIRKREHIALVVDEYGSVSGLVTMEDILEEVVGEVRDEFDGEEDEPLTLVAPGHLVAQGTVQLDNVKRYVVVGQHEHDVHTVGGLVWAQLGHRPEVGDEPAVAALCRRIGRPALDLGEEAPHLGIVLTGLGARPQ